MLYIIITCSTQHYIIIHIHTHLYILRPPSPCQIGPRDPVEKIIRREESLVHRVYLGLYTIFFTPSRLHESIVLSFFRPACIARTVAIPSHAYWAIYAPPLDFPFVCQTPYNIGDNKIVYRPRRITRVNPRPAP